LGFLTIALAIVTRQPSQKKPSEVGVKKTKPKVARRPAANLKILSMCCRADWLKEEK